MKGYSGYKASDISWIGEIPEHWKVDKLGMHFRQRNEKVSDKEFPALSVSKEGVTPQLSTAVKTDNGDNRKKVCKGDFVVNSRSDRKGSCGFSSYDGSVSLINIVVTPIDLCDRYYHYLFRSNNYIEEFYRLGRGIVADLWTTRYVEMRNIMIPLPPIEEQQEIVSFLDEKTTKIDEYIDKKNKEIEALKEWKKALITHVVTKGLNTNSKMKDSGVSWIGEIPEHWKVDKLGMHFRQRNEKVSDKEFPALSVSKEGVTPQLSTAVKTDNGDNRKKVCKGDFVVNSRSDRKGSCGFSSYDGSVSLINIVVTPIDLCDRYYHYLFRSNNYIEEFYRLGRGIVADLWTTRYVEMRNIMIPLPPIEEQQEIVEYIDAATTKADKMIVELTNHVESMKEYKQRLIADVVTGKINVQP